MTLISVKDYMHFLLLLQNEMTECEIVINHLSFDKQDDISSLEAYIAELKERYIENVTKLVDFIGGINTLYTTEENITFVVYPDKDLQFVIEIKNDLTLRSVL